MMPVAGSNSLISTSAGTGGDNASPPWNRATWQIRSDTCSTEGQGSHSTPPGRLPAPDAPPPAPDVPPARAAPTHHPRRRRHPTHHPRRRRHPMHHPRHRCPQHQPRCHPFLPRPLTGRRRYPGGRPPRHPRCPLAPRRPRSPPALRFPPTPSALQRPTHRLIRAESQNGPRSRPGPSTAGRCLQDLSGLLFQTASRSPRERCRVGARRNSITSYSRRARFASPGKIGMLASLARGWS